MFLLIFGIEGHGTQLYFDICELPIGVTFRLAPFLHSLRARTWLLVLPLLPLAMTPCLTLRPRDFKGSTANLQTGNCLGFATKPHSWFTHACQHADSTVSQTYRQRSNRDEHGYRHATCMYLKWLQTRNDPSLTVFWFQMLTFHNPTHRPFAKLPLVNITDQFSLSNCCYLPCYQTGFCISIIQVYMDNLCVLIV